MNEKDIQRFWAKVDKEKSNVFYNGERCWEWTGGKMIKGYGNFRMGLDMQSRLIGAHRFSYEIANGEIPEGLLVLHHCDNPPCVNDAHLFLGTIKDNTHDAIRKGRLAHGERVWGSKLTDAKIIEIRMKYSTGKFSQQGLADEYDMAQTTIGQIVRKENWKHVG